MTCYRKILDQISAQNCRVCCPKGSEWLPIFPSPPKWIFIPGCMSSSCYNLEDQTIVRKSLRYLARIRDLFTFWDLYVCVFPWHPWLCPCLKRIVIENIILDVRVQGIASRGYQHMDQGWSELSCCCPETVRVSAVQLGRGFPSTCLSLSSLFL